MTINDFFAHGAFAHGAVDGLFVASSARAEPLSAPDPDDPRAAEALDRSDPVPALLRVRHGAAFGRPRRAKACAI